MTSMPRLFFILLFLVCHFGVAQAIEVAMAVPEGRIMIGDDPAYADVQYDDADWQAGHWSEVEHKGLWWFRTEFTLPARIGDANVPLGLYVIAVASSEIWLDGVKLGSNGMPSDSASTEEPGLLNAVFALPESLADGETHQLTIRFSSQHTDNRIFTPVDGVFIGPYGSLLGLQQPSYLPTILVAGAIGLSSLVLMVMAFATRSRRSVWLLTGSLFALLQMALEVVRVYVNYPYPWHVWRLLGISICAAVTSVMIIAYLADRFSMRWQYRITAVFALLFIGLLFVIPHSDLVSLLMYLVTMIAGLLICVMAKSADSGVRLITAMVLTAILVVLVMDPWSFQDRYYYYGITCLLLLFFVEHVIDYTRTLQRLDRARIRSTRLRLELLKQYLRPHFLLNTLTSLSEWFAEDQKIGQRMLEVLSEELRLLEQFVDKTRVSIDDELNLCRLHLELYGYRQDRQYVLDVEGQAHGFEIPPAIIHTLLENALTHNSYDAPTTHFTLQVTQASQRIALMLKTPMSHQASVTESNGEGAGLRYVRVRLEESFGEDYALTSVAEAGDWVSTIEFPMITSAEDVEDAVVALS